MSTPERGTERALRKHCSPARPLPHTHVIPGYSVNPPLNHGFGVHRAGPGTPTAHPCPPGLMLVSSGITVLGSSGFQGKLFPTILPQHHLTPRGCSLLQHWFLSLSKEGKPAKGMPREGLLRGPEYESQLHDLRRGTSLSVPPLFLPAKWGLPIATT